MKSEKALKFILSRLNVPVADAAEMRLELYGRILRTDNYVKVRRILSKLSVEDRLALDANSIGETRYAHVLYAIDACLARYMSFVLGKPVSAILSGDDLTKPSAYSLCPYCGDRIVDVGRQRRKCCTKGACRREYERVRKRERRERERADRKH